MTRDIWPKTWPDDVEEAAQAVAGNHYRIPHFAWDARPDDGDLWMLYHTKHVESDALTESNHFAILKALPETEDRVAWQVFDHFVYGGNAIDAVAIRVYTETPLGSTLPEGDGTFTMQNGVFYRKEITDEFRTFHGLMERMEGYPVLDEEDWTEREEVRAIQTLKDAAEYRDGGEIKLTDDQAYAVREWLHNKRNLGDGDLQEYVRDKQDFEDALDALGIAPEPEEDEDAEPAAYVVPELPTMSMFGEEDV